MQAIAVLVTHQTREGQRDAVRAIWEEHLAPAIAANAGHLTYVYCFDDRDPNTISAFQLYRNADEAAAFLKTTAYAAYEEAVAPLLEGVPSVRLLTPEWIKPMQG